MKVVGIATPYILPPLSHTLHGTRVHTHADTHTHTQRCGDTHRDLLQSKDYVQVSLQRGLDRMTVTCPRSMQAELRRCISNKQEQGYTMHSLTEE